MEYINITDIDDKFLNVTENEIKQANSFIEDTATQMGINLSSIKVPVTFTIRRIGVLFACYTCCLARVGTDPTTSFENGNRQDIYAQKLGFYKQELNQLVSRLTRADFVGQKASGTTINLWRS